MVRNDNSLIVNNQNLSGRAHRQDVHDTVGHLINSVVTQVDGSRTNVVYNLNVGPVLAWQTNVNASGQVVQTRTYSKDGRFIERDGSGNTTTHQSKGELELAKVVQNRADALIKMDRDTSHKHRAFSRF